MNSDIRNVRLYDVPVPRGASVAASLFAGAYQLVSRLFTSKPEQPLTPAEEAEEVRALARSVASTDPGFASDLFAAADRHEAQ
jgi:hypothetical protein